MRDKEATCYNSNANVMHFMEVLFMSEQITVRVPKELRRRIENAARRSGVRKSDIARQALEEYLSSSERISDTRPINKVKTLIGSVNSGKPDLGEMHREHLIKRLARRDA